MTDHATPLTALEAAILRTLLYADVFQFPLTRAELHSYLIHDRPIAFDQIEGALESPQLCAMLCESEGYITFRTTPHYITRRLEREALAQTLLPQAQKYGRWLALLPF